MSAQKGKPNSRRKANILIAINTMFVIFGLASGFTGTMAWFNSQRATELTASSFSISALPETQFELYYLDHFVDSDGALLSYGNQNLTTNKFSGYEVEYSRAVFTKVDYDTDGVVTDDPNPTDIAHLWPAHKLTFALFITEGDFSSFSLNNWSESEEGEALVGADSPVLLSWAINIYGGVYRVEEPEGELSDDEKASLALSTGFTAYHNASKTDGFGYSQDSPAVKDEDGICNTPSTIIPSGSTTGTGSLTIAYFSIEFSNAESTFYSQSLASPYYYFQDDFGDSNCYEGLHLTSLQFGIK